MCYISHCHLLRDVLYLSLSPAEKCLIFLTVTCRDKSYIFRRFPAEKCFISLKKYKTGVDKHSLINCFIWRRMLLLIIFLITNSKFKKYFEKHFEKKFESVRKYRTRNQLWFGGINFL